MNAELHTTTDSQEKIADLYDQNLISEQEYSLMREGIIPEYAKKWVIREFGGVPSRVRRQLQSVALEEEYEPQLAITIVYGVICSQKSLQKWIEANLKKSYQFISVSRKENGKWVDMEATLWPPYQAPNTESGVINKTVYHRPARYVFKHGDIRVDLGSQQENYSPILHNNPNSAMQSVATRLGRAIGGDYNTVAQKIVGDDSLIATSTSMRIGNQWIVLISMMRNPKLTNSSYNVGVEGVVLSADEHNPPSKISEVEYALIKGIIEEEDEHCADYTYEFDQDMQSQMLMQPMSDKLNTEEMTYSELLVHDIAAINDDLIDYMNESATYLGNDYDEIVDSLVEDETNRLYTKYNTNRLTYSINEERKRALKNSRHADEQGKQFIINQSESRITELIAASNKFDHKLYYRCLIQAANKYDEVREAIEEVTCVHTPEVSKTHFTMKGSDIHRKRFFGVPSAYNGSAFMPARNPFSQTKFLSSVPNGDMSAKQAYKHNSGIERKLKKREGSPSGTSIIKRMKIPYNCEYVDAYGNRGITPTKKPKQFNLQDHPRLAAIVSSFELTGSLPKAIRTTKRKLSFA